MKEKPHVRWEIWFAGKTVVFRSMDAISSDIAKNMAKHHQSDKAKAVAKHMATVLIVVRGAVVHNGLWGSGVHFIGQVCLWPNIWQRY